MGVGLQVELDLPVEAQVKRAARAFQILPEVNSAGAISFSGHLNVLRICGVFRTVPLLRAILISILDTLVLEFPKCSAKG